MCISKLAVFIQVPYEHGKSKGFSFYFRECIEHQKKHLVNQDKVQKSVREGTLGIRSIKCQSGIFSKWLRLWQNSGLWKSVLTSFEC